jgi:hypothetical protein
MINNHTIMVSQYIHCGYFCILITRVQEGRNTQSIIEENGNMKVCTANVLNLDLYYPNSAAGRLCVILSIKGVVK